MDDNLEQKIVEIFLNKYKNDLAAILVFGSYFTGNYKKNKSDLDLIILLKKNPTKEKKKKELMNKVPSLKLFVHHLRTINDYKKEIYSQGSWSSWVVITKGSKIIYSTPKFKLFQTYLTNHPLDKDKLKEFIIDKDKFDLEIDLSKKSGWNATKMLFAHIRRKLQILYYYTKNQIEPDFYKCLINLNLEYENELKRLNNNYIKRVSCSIKEINNYVKISKKLTKEAINTLS